MYRTGDIWREIAHLYSFLILSRDPFSEATSHDEQASNHHEKCITQRSGTAITWVLPMYCCALDYKNIPEIVK